MRPIPAVTCIGELLVDFISTRPGRGLADAPEFLKRAGGSAANVAVGLSRLGIPSAFAGRIGGDSFGRFLRSELESEGVDTKQVVTDSRRLTRLAFVSLTVSGERQFEFHERNPADEALRKPDLQIGELARSGIVHFSSFPLIHAQSRGAVLGAVPRLRQRGVQISFDPNIRAGLWKSEGEARRVLSGFLRHATILRLNGDEAAFLTGHRRVREAAAALLAEGPALVVITSGARGCHMATDEISADATGFRVKVVDTTGCGDGFLAGLLAGIVRRGGRIAGFSKPELLALGRYANAAGSLTATRYGVISALPSDREVLRLISRKGKE